MSVIGEGSGVGGGNVSDGGAVLVTTTTNDSGGEHNANSASGGNAVGGSGSTSAGSGGGKGHLSQTPRFTQDEKDVLYALFHEHEDIIDIKYRKKQRSKYSVRDAWTQIVTEFNSHPNVCAMRNLKQIQKFWLNARLRKQYPFRALNQKGGNSAGGAGGGNQLAIKDEPEFQLSANESSQQNAQSDGFEEIEMDTSGVSQMDDDGIDQQEQPQQQQLQHVQQQQLQQHVQQHQAQATTIQTQQISVDQISAEKLTLHDLLQFKRPREEIILQIKHPTDPTPAQITIPSPTRITLPTHHQPQQHTMATITASGYNQQIISEIKPQQITLAQYQAQQQIQQQQLQQQQQQIAQQQQQLLAAQQQQQQQQQQQHQVKVQLQTSSTPQFVAGTPTFTCTTLGALPATTVTTTPATISAAAVTATPAASVNAAVETFEEKINFFKLKEAELRYKSEVVDLEKKRIELSRAQDDLKQMREMHRLRVEEVKMKIRILQEEEKVLQKNLSSGMQP